MFWNKNNQLGWYGSKLNDYKTVLQSGDFSSIPWVFCVLSEKHDASKIAVADILCDALEKMSFDDLIRVDEQMRQTTSMEWSIDWRRLSIDSFFTSEMNKDARRAVIVFASFNPNGFIRERAVRMMKDYDGMLPFATLRLNDWVSQVQKSAVETADYRLSNLAAGELIAALPFADKLSRSGRIQNANTYIKRIFSALTFDENEKELFIGLSSDNIRTRRICTTALFNADHPRYDIAVNRLQSETDPFLRANIFRKLIAAGKDLNAVAERLLTDKYPLNRMLAFQYICDTNDVKALQWAEILLLDKSMAARETSRFYLGKNAPRYDYRAFYKSRLNDSTASAILGLGEVGISEDVSDIENYLKSEQISIVRAAMFAVMRLDSEKYSPQITDFLSDNRTGIVKTACNLIMKTAVPDYTRVMEIFRTTKFTNTRQKCFSVLLTASKWQRLIFILDILEIGDSDMIESATVALDRWFDNWNRSYTVATSAQIEKITESIERLGNRLPTGMHRQLLFLLR
ncbi:MAG: hypothetical protein FWG69_02040 [Oscillospiraceae bacterium]|nr:hypothetical protein [Oscillospiraceae bacterium]